VNVRGWLFAFALIATLMLVGCNLIRASNAHGYGDTKTNPDNSFICAAATRTAKGTDAAYLTVAGSDRSAGDRWCSTAAKGSWKAITTIAAAAYDTPARCYLTTDRGGITARIYTAVHGSTSKTKALCAQMFQKAGSAAGPLVTAPRPPAAKCVDSSLGIHAGWDTHHYVDSTATEPCWAHEIIDLAPGCTFFLDDQPTSPAPVNIWNVDRWAYGTGSTAGEYSFHTAQGDHLLLYTCADNARLYPQTALHNGDY
jgi:hypothetical protein